MDILIMVIVSLPAAAFVAWCINYAIGAFDRPKSVLGKDVVYLSEKALRNYSYFCKRERWHLSECYQKLFRADIICCDEKGCELRREKIAAIANATECYYYLNKNKRSVDRAGNEDSLLRNYVAYKYEDGFPHFVQGLSVPDFAACVYITKYIIDDARSESKKWVIKHFEEYAKLNKWDYSEEQLVAAIVKALVGKYGTNVIDGITQYTGIDVLETVGMTKYPTSAERDLGYKVVWARGA